MNFNSRYFSYRTKNYKRGLSYFCYFSLAWITLLLFAGGFTTSIDAGMAFLDWPLSNGSLNPKGWLENEDMLAEHSHRLLGAKIGLLSIIIFFWHLLREERIWLRRLSLLLVGAVIFQGLLGGFRVLLDQQNIMTENNTIAKIFLVLHAMGAQFVLIALTTIAFGQSSFFQDLTKNPPFSNKKVNLFGGITISLLLATLLVGAVMRHQGNQASLSIPTFPYSSPSYNWLPPMWNFNITINFVHRVLAVLSTFSLIVFAGAMWGINQRFGIRLLIGFPCVMIIIQIYLGALVIWTQVNSYSATIHMLNGAFLLAGTWLLFFTSIFRWSTKKHVLNTSKVSVVRELEYSH